MRIIYLIILSLACLISYGQDVRIDNSVTEIMISNIDNMSIRETKSLTILNENGQHHSVFYGYEDDFTKLTSLSMTVYNSAGKKIKKIGKGYSENWNVNAKNEIDNTELVILDPDFQDYPYTVELVSEIKMNKGFLSLPLWMPRESFEMEVKKASLTLTKPQNYEVNYLLEHLEEPLIHIEKGMEVWSWELQDLAAVSNEISYKQFKEEQPKVYLGPLQFSLDGNDGSFENWQNFGEWYLALNDEPYEFGQETLAFLESVSAEDVPSLIHELYTFMQRRSRYISIQLGVGGYQSLPTKYVDEKGYGDCKALSNYMKSMLDYKGLESNFILVNAGKDRDDIKPEIVSNQFNHVFLAVPNDSDTVFLECTTQLMPTGFTGTFTDDRHVLWIEQGGSQIIKMPALDLNDNVLKSTGTLVLDKFGNGELNLKRERGGLFFEDIQLLTSINEGQREGYLYNQFSYKDFIIRDFSYEQPKDNTNTYLTEYDLVINNVARNTSDRLLVPVHSLDQIEDFLVFNRYKRFAEVRRAFTLDEKVIVKLPEGFHVSRLPELSKLESQYGTYSCQIKDLTDGRIEIIRKVVIDKGRFTNEDFVDFSKFISGIKKADRTSLIITAGT